MVVALDRRLPYGGGYSAGREYHNRMDLLGFCSSFYVHFLFQSHAKMGCFIFIAIAKYKEIDFSFTSAAFYPKTTQQYLVCSGESSAKASPVAIVLMSFPSTKA